MHAARRILGQLRSQANSCSNKETPIHKEPAIRYPEEAMWYPEPIEAEFLLSGACDELKNIQTLFCIKPELKFDKLHQIYQSEADFWERRQMFFVETRKQ